MKISYLNEEHKVIVENLERKIKKVMYFATENVSEGKYQDFLHMLTTVYIYSNNFHDTILKKEKDDGVVSEFIFLIPNMTFYTAIGFLTALKDGKNNLELQYHLESIGHYCELATGELADIIIDSKENIQLLKDIEGVKITQN